MNKCKIYVEGVADQKFIADFINYYYNISLIKGSDREGVSQTDNLIEIGGIDNKEKITKAFFERNSLQGITNIIIFDADEDIKKRKKELQDLKSEYNVGFEFFLFPNNKDAGDLEDLLMNIINPDNNKIFNCWDGYEKCLLKISSDLTLPAKKTKIYAYLEPLLGETNSQKEKIKEVNRDYTNKNHWNLNSEYLVPLKSFLDKFFKKK
ncbi:MAG: hypothetical protein L3J35_01390 [Bacteroidales bacterium]|nr:hypothetical protein [Bacteroidales bacterium]